jgi:SnoaL-like protein
MTQADPLGFVETFTQVWASPEPEAFAELWAEGGILLHPTMGTSIAKEEIPDYVRRLKSFVPDISLEPKRWASSGNDLFIEWTISMTPPGEDEPISWDGVDRFTLKGDRAVEGIAYFDTSPMWGRMGASPEEGDLLDAAATRREAEGTRA